MNTRKVLSHERQHYVIDNLNLVHYLLRKRYGMTPAHIDYEDYFQTGCVGLILAAIRFDDSKGFQFSTYASQMIWGCIQRYRRDCLPEIKVTRNGWSQLYKAVELQMQGVDNASIANILGITPYELNQLYAVKGIDSLNRKIDEKDGSVSELQDIIPSGHDSDYENALEEENILSCINKVSHELDGYTRDIWEEYIYAIYYGEKLSQMYFADKYEISQAHVSRLLNRCKKLFVEFLYE